VEKDMTNKEALRRLVDELPPQELPAARRFLEYLRDRGDPVLRAFLDAPEDDEPLSPEDEAAVAEAEEQLRQKAGVPWGQVRRSILRE